MTLPFERARAVIQTQKFLMDLRDLEKTPRVPLVIRDRARALLRHYPTLHDLEMVERAWHVVGIKDMVECPFSTKDDLFGELK